MSPTSFQTAPPRAAWYATRLDAPRLHRDAGGVVSFAKQDRELTIGVSAPEDVRKSIVRTLRVNTSVARSALLTRATRAARKNDAILVGDEASGRFSHELVKGEYHVVGQTVVVTITDKHWMLPWPVVEFRLREFVA